MKKSTLLLNAACILTVLLAVCTKLNPNETTEYTVAAERHPEPPVLEETNTPFTSLDPYATLVESYVNGAVFRQMNDHQTKQLSQMLLGHYDIMGRTAGQGMDYYLAVRRKDAPVYNDFKNNNIQYFSGPHSTGPVLQIGYYDKNSNSTILYEVEGYDLLEQPLGNENLDCFCFGAAEASNDKADQAFKLAFTQSGRDTIDFVRKNEGLSLAVGDSPYIEFYYQDDDTLKFYSSPYPCFIIMNEEELKEIRGLLASLKPESSIITSWNNVVNFLHTQDGAIQLTGVSLYVDGIKYDFWGNNNSAGYMISSTVQHEFISLQYNETVYNMVMDKIQNVVEMDYRNFDAHWFETPLKSASIDFPERIQAAGGFYDTVLKSQAITDAGKLDALSQLMDKALNDETIYGFSACPYDAVIKFTREDGETLRIFIATDSCGSMAYEGRIGFEYGRQSDLAAIFDEAMADRPLN